MKRALVLGGGGSKGAYQTGSYKALLELGFSFDLVVGVSIGSLNAALIVQDEFDKLENLWNSVELNGIIKNGLNLTYDMDYYFDNKASILPLLKTYAENKGMDIAPLVNLVKNNIDFKKLTESSIDFGLLSVEVPNLAPHEITKKDLTQNNYDKWVLASCACFPAFPMSEIDGKKYIDGGYYDNLPIDLAFKMGASEVIAISLNYKFETKYDLHPLVSHIRPSSYLGTMLNFSNKDIKHNIKLGYLDCLKHFKKLDGIKYAFNKLESSEHIEKVIKKLLLDLLNAELKLESSEFLASIESSLSKIGLISKVTTSTPFSDKLLSLLNTKLNARTDRSEDVKMLFLMLVENYMEINHFDNTEIYNIDKVIKEAKINLTNNKAISNIKSQILESKTNSWFNNLESTLLALLLEVILNL